MHLFVRYSTRQAARCCNTIEQWTKPPSKVYNGAHFRPPTSFPHPFSGLHLAHNTLLSLYLSLITFFLIFATLPLYLVLDSITHL